MNTDHRQGQRIFQSVGWQAAELLDRLMRGEQAPAEPVLVAPDGVVERRSTQTLAIEDPQVAAVVRHIREHLHEPFGVERVLSPASHADGWSSASNRAMAAAPTQ